MAEPYRLEMELRPTGNFVPVSFGHPLIAPVRVALERGRHPGRWGWILLSSPGQLLRVIGSVAVTKDRRVIFFPGARLKLAPGAGFVQDGCELDHITMDPPRGGLRRSHVAVFGLHPRKGGRGLEWATAESSAHFTPMLSLLLPSKAGLYRIPNRLSCTFPATVAPDRLLGFPLKPAYHLDLPLPSPWEAPHFLQVDVWICDAPSWEGRTSAIVPWSTNTLLVKDGKPEPPDPTFSAVTFRAGENLFVRVVVTQPGGIVAAPCVARPNVSFDT